MKLVERVLAGDHRAVARLITLIENADPKAWEILTALYPHTGKAYVVGVTGAPGIGKSTLVNQLGKLYRQKEKTVGIIGVDPTSPFSHGAVLGDRVRMYDLFGDPGAYIRSMATRGSLGGIALTTSDVCKVLDAAGFEMIFIETVGAGQAEVEIAKIVDTTIVVTAPGLGDGIQALKAGIMEIADIFVVNKADRGGADQVIATLESMLDFGRSLFPPGKKVAEREQGALHSEGEVRWRPPVCEASAVYGDGTTEVVEAIEEHRAYVQKSGERQRRERERVETELRSMISQKLTERFFELMDARMWGTLVSLILRRDLDPYSAVTLLLGKEACPSRSPDQRVEDGEEG